VRLRDLVFWLHLGVGLSAGLVVAVLSGTGVVLAFERQLTAWADGYEATPTPGARRLGVEALLGRAREARPGAAPTAFTLLSDPREAAVVAYGRDDVLYLDPFSGSVLGPGSKTARAVFRVATAWHRWLGAEGEGRAVGRAITGACNMGFLVLVLTGPVLWWPAGWKRRHLEPIVLIGRGLAGRARDFNWHNVAGIWSAVPLLLVVTSAVVMSYPWANDLLYRLGGDVPPARREDRPPGARPGLRADGRSRRGEDLDTSGLDRLWARAETQVPEWRVLTLRLPATGQASVTFSIDTARGAVRPDKRSQLVLDRESGGIVRWEPFSSQGRGRRLRAWIRWLHTGEALGWPGQAVAAMASAGAALLVWTGFSLAWRRFFPRGA
jgi:uncharacterized iron-regulated membrane protein